MKSVDESLTAFESYKAEYKNYIESDLSESDTRSKLIDKILIDVLGWDERDIKREGHVDSGYFDYRVTVPGIVFLVEAKRQFKEFNLPSNHKKASIKTLLKENSEVINQIRNYCLDEGIPYGIITNGYQYILCRLNNVDGKPWKENIALIFNGIQDIDGRFIEFYDNLSKFSIVSNGGFKYDLPINGLEGKTILSYLVDKDRELIRNSFSAVLTPLVDQVFGEMFLEEREDDIEFIRQCFVQNEETKKNKNEIERLFIDEAPAFSNIVPIVNTDNLARTIVDEINGVEINIRNSYPPKPIIIIGSKGAGKSTFINHLFKYKTTKHDLEHHFVIYIDFRKFYETHSFFEPEKLASEILEAIYNKYGDLELHSLTALKRIYYKEIKRNDDSIWKWYKENDENEYQKKLSIFLEEELKNYLSHLTLLSHYLIRDRRKRLVVIIDNADQFNDQIQEKLFIFSHSLTKSSFCGTVISIREGYYRKWQNSPPFDAYESNIYHITAPRYAEVLQKRVEYAIKQIEKKPSKYLINLGHGKIIDITPGYVVEFLKSLENSLFFMANSALIDFVNRTTYPNIREGLRVFKIFLNSGHTKVSEYIDRERQRLSENRSHQVIPIHEFIKSIALVNRLYYNSETSIIYNLLIPPIDSCDHFIKLYILNDLAEIIENRSYTEKQVKNTTVIDKLSSSGYKLNVINFALFSLIKASLLDTDEQLSDIEWTELPSEYNITLTAKGFYYIKELIYKFHYYDLILQDTPIFNSERYQELVDNFPQASKDGTRNFEQRKEFIKTFFKYLADMEEKQGNKVMTIYGKFTDNINKKVFSDVVRWSQF